MIRLKLEYAGCTFTVKDFEGFQRALTFFSVEKGLSGVDWIWIATPPEIRVLSWLPTGIRVELGTADELHSRRVWNLVADVAQANAELGAYCADPDIQLPPQEPMQYTF